MQSNKNVKYSTQILLKILLFFICYISVEQQGSGAFYVQLLSYKDNIWPLNSLVLFSKHTHGMSDYGDRWLTLITTEKASLKGCHSEQELVFLM